MSGTGAPKWIIRHKKNCTGQIVQLILDRQWYKDDLGFIRKQELVKN